VIFFPDGDLRPDTIAAEQLRQYRTVILPECHFLTVPQAEALRGYLEDGGRLLALGAPGANLPGDVRRALREHERATIVDSQRDFVPGELPDEPQVRIEPAVDIAINLQRVETGVALHFIRYDYDQEHDRVPELPNLVLEIRLPERFTNIAAHSPSGQLEADLTVKGQLHRIELRNVELYGIVSLTNEVKSVS